MKKMIWSRLKNMKCPKCNGDLITSNSGIRAVGCEDQEGCEFYMRKETFDRVVTSLYKGMGTKEYKPQFGQDNDAFEIINSNEYKENE